MSRMENHLDSGQHTAAESPWQARNLMPLLKETNRLPKHNTPPRDANSDHWMGA